MMDILTSPLSLLALQIVLVVVLTLLAGRGLLLIGRTFQRRVEKTVADPARQARLKTLLQVGQSVTYALVLIIAGLILLTLLGINIVPLLAGAGVVGLALSLGAQTLVKDFIGGVLILVENWFSLGDVIQVGSHSGQVEKITLRATYLRDIDGRLHMIPNGDVRTLSNLSAGWAAATVDLNIAYAENMDAALKALESAAQRVAEDESFKADLIEAPRVMSWFGLGDWAVQVRLIAKVKPAKQPLVAAGLRKYALEALREQGIQPALPRQAVEVGKD